MGDYDFKPGGGLKFKGGGSDKKKKKKSSTSERVRALESSGASGSGSHGVDNEDRQRSTSIAREGSADAASRAVRGGSEAVEGSGSNDERYTSPSGGAAEGSSSSTSLSKQRKESTSTGYSKYMTESERRYEEVRRKRLAEKVRKEAKKSHKDRVQEFNDKLERLSEHHDLPRIGPG
ncbi:DUF1754-domain-containing protein [Cystobasidium minutum MCA 4210]|uniref:DUF1754-domain-containing protein n=1 Tax=Cystobasidium minutum MCA 4210 TaxID=1397322 RepID=UPI0034CD6275|eukprot:jgi/Rhomi1/170804/fgenesh1_kg.4_\